jgi:dTDP-4-amino-4,6-dideoxygalactose transaminase
MELSKPIPFNKPYLTGKENHYIYQAVLSGKISGDGIFTKKCSHFFESKYGFKKCLLTTSCTDALEMAAILLNIKEGDEVIVPSYTFVSSANAFVLRGAHVVFADSYKNHPNLDADSLELLITERTKAIVVVHYAGIACDMNKIMALAKQYNLVVIEDAAQAIDSFYFDKPLGSIGHLAAFSFHETKNIMSGEGGMLIINDEKYINRAEIIREKGTNRSAFFRGEIDKYNWVDVGSSFLPSDILAAFLFAQLESLDEIQLKRKHIWETYFKLLFPLQKEGKVILPNVPNYSTNNAHMFFLLCKNPEERQLLIERLKGKHVMAVFHYLSLHKSPFYLEKHKGGELSNADFFSDTLLRLPLYYELSEEEIQFICQTIIDFYNT